MNASTHQILTAAPFRRRQTAAFPARNSPHRLGITPRGHLGAHRGTAPARLRHRSQPAPGLPPARRARRAARGRSALAVRGTRRRSAATSASSRKPLPPTTSSKKPRARRRGAKASWFSPNRRPRAADGSVANGFRRRGKGLWFSVLLRPELRPQAATQLTVAAATALARAIRGKPAWRPKSNGRMTF